MTLENHRGIITADGASQDTKQIALIIAGMHRSGTSALTRVLNLMGVALPDNLIPPAEDNVRGFWESETIKQIHDDILESAGSCWQDISEFPPAWFASLTAQKYEDKIIQILKTDLSDLPLYAIKDPRICRLIPLWLNILNKLSTEVRFIIPLRHPLEIAASLKKRHGFDTNRSLLLWLGHFLDAEKNTRDQIRCFVTYEQLLASWQTLIVRLETELKIVFPRRSHLATLEIEQFLSHGLRHHNVPYDDLFSRSDIVCWINEAFTWGLAASRGESVSPEILDNIREAWKEADKIYAPLVIHYDLLQKQHSDFARQHSLIVEQYQQGKSQIEQLETQLNNYQAECDQTRAELANFQAQLEHTRSESAHFQAQLEHTRSESAHFQAQLEHTRSESAHFQALSEQVGAELTQLRHQLEHTQGELSHTQAQLENTRAELTLARTLSEQTAVELTQVRLELDNTRNQLTEAKAEGEQQEVELDQIRAQLEDTQVKLTQQEDLQAQLARAQAEREQLKSELTRTQEQLKHSQAQLASSDTEAKRVKSELAQAHQQLHQSYQEWEQAQNQLEQALYSWERAHLIIEAMESSKFWQLRQKWFKIKPLLGLKVK